VKVKEDWRSKKGFVEELDWRRQLESLQVSQALKKENEA
jgi:GTP-binding protein Era